MKLSIAVALMIGCVLGVFCTLIIVGLALSRRLRTEQYEPNKNRTEETEQHE